MVDEAKEIILINDDEIHRLHNDESTYLLGVTKVEGRLIPLMDVDRLLNNLELIQEQIYEYIPI